MGRDKFLAPFLWPISFDKPSLMGFGVRVSANGICGASINLKRRYFSFSICS
jgi:hypothetical protein